MHQVSEPAGLDNNGRSVRRTNPTVNGATAMSCTRTRSTRRVEPSRVGRDIHRITSCTNVVVRRIAPHREIAVEEWPSRRQRGPPE
jgi:hypothetical protein